MDTLALTGFNAVGNTPQLGKDVVYFSDIKGNVTITKDFLGGKEAIALTTKRQTYVLYKHASLNIYTGVANGHKVHVSLKKLVGEVRYW